MRLSQKEMTWLLIRMKPGLDDDLISVHTDSDIFGPVSLQPDGQWLTPAPETSHGSAIEACAAMCRRCDIDGYPVLPIP